MEHGVVEWWEHLDVITLLSNTPAPQVNLGALFLSRFNVGHDTLVGPREAFFFFFIQGGETKSTHIKLNLRDLGSLVGILGEGVTDPDRLGPLGELFEEFVVNPRLDEDATASAATLAVVPATQTPLDIGTNRDES